jgi:hypothetical protein
MSPPPQVIAGRDDPVSRPDGRFVQKDFACMDVRTLILLTPAAIFVVSGLIWFWTNEL